MTERADGKPLFLVESNEHTTGFPVIPYDKANTGLANAIQYIKENFQLDIEKLELVELTNVVVKNHRIPLFVFSYHHNTANLDKALPASSNFKWETSDNFSQELKNYDISGVPIF